MFRLLGVYQQLVCQLLSSLAVRFNATAAAMVVVVCCGTGNWLGVGLQQCSYFLHKSQSVDERQTTHKNVYLCLEGKKSQIHKFSWWFVFFVIDFWVCSSSILFLDVPLILFLRDYTFDDVTTTPLLVGYVISIFATSQNSLWTLPRQISLDTSAASIFTLWDLAKIVQPFGTISGA